MPRSGSQRIDVAGSTHVKPPHQRRWPMVKPMIPVTRKYLLYSKNQLMVKAASTGAAYARRQHVLRSGPARPLPLSAQPRFSRPLTP
eukprot:6214010-Pleurochrysis_carterae.AAC.2